MVRLRITLIALLLLASLSTGEASDGRATTAATYHGGNGYEDAAAVAIGPDGSVYVAGTTGSTDFGGGNGGNFDIYVSRLSSDLSRVMWTVQQGGYHFDDAYGLAVAPDGSAYVVGDTRSHNFPVSSGAFDTTWNGPYDALHYDAFVMKVSAAGALVWSSLLGGSGFERATDVAIDPSGRVTIVGTTGSCDFPTSAGAHKRVLSGCPGAPQNDAFVVKLSSDGATMSAGTFVGGAGWENGVALAVSPASGSVLLAGRTSSSDLPTTVGAHQRTLHADGYDAYVAKLDGALERLQHATYLGFGSESEVADIARDASSGVYLTGRTWGTHPTTAGAYQTQHQSPTGCQDGRDTFNGPCADGFVTKVASDLSRLSYSTYLGLAGEDEAIAIAVDASGRAHVAGSTGSDQGRYTLLASDGARVEHEQSLGGSGWDGAQSVATSGDAAFVSGFVASSDFATSETAAEPTMSGYQDAFVARIGFTVATPPAGVIFDHRGGNEWWVEARVTGGVPTQVQAMDANSAWKDLTLRSWGNWAGGFHIEPGNTVKFRARVDGAWQESCAFTHPAGKTPTGSETCHATALPPADTATWYNASFWGIKGNQWWVEARVDGPVTKVEARVEGGAWRSLTLRSWGAWAASFHVPEGSLVQLRALRDDGLWGYQAQGWTWPNAAPHPGYGNAGAAFDAAFHNVGGNAFYQQVNVYATWNLDGVEVSINGGAWRPMERKAWGDWASGLSAPEGSTVRFRALGGGGSDASGPFAWVPA